MKRVILAVALCALPLAACSHNGGINGPGTVADQTVADEKAMLAIESAYQLAARVGLDLVNAHEVDPVQFKALSDRAYTALLAVRSAYDAGNAASFQAALVLARQAVIEMRAFAQPEISR